MGKHDIRFTAIPSTEEVAAERDRLAYQSRYKRVLKSTIYALVVVAAAAVLLATLLLPVLQVSGDSMNRRSLRILLAKQTAAQAHHRQAGRRDRHGRERCGERQWSDARGTVCG